MNSSPATLRDVCTQHGVPVSKSEKEMKSLPMQYCVKSVRIRSFSGPYFPTFGLYTERYETSFRIRSECGEIRTRKTPNTDVFQAL